MDYLMVPTSASPIEKQDQAMFVTQGKPEPATTQGPSTSADLKQEPSIFIPAAPARSKLSHKGSKIHKGQRGNRSAHHTPKIKQWFFSALDPVFLCVYVVEAILKFIALDFNYFRDPWNDIGEVTENLQEITGTFMLSFQSIGAIILLMFSFLFMSSVVLLDMFQEADKKHFGDLFKTIFTLFQLFTLDDWSIIYLTCYAAGAWYIIIFLIIYILVEYFLLLNLVIAVLVDNFQMSLLKRQEKKKLKVNSGIYLGAGGAKNCPAEGQHSRGRSNQASREWQLLYNYFQIMTAVENSQQQFQSQASTTDKILDTFFEVWIKNLSLIPSAPQKTSIP
ncbi:hypothetical protein Chor_014816 [Crotalus horridus]